LFYKLVRKTARESRVLFSIYLSDSLQCKHNFWTAQLAVQFVVANQPVDPFTIAAATHHMLRTVVVGMKTAKKADENFRRTENVQLNFLVLIFHQKVSHTS
jgi:hypothetical protein